MSNREENLKKINAELEKLNDEELEKIAGGFYARSNGVDIKKESDVNKANQNKIIHWTAQAKLGY